jgi:endonuclease YncB( thermonuclease family)
VVITGEGTDLAADLVAAGLARIHGRPVSSPDGRSGAEIVADLAALEKRARENKRGAWAWVNPAKK